MEQLNLLFIPVAGLYVFTAVVSIKNCRLLYSLQGMYTFLKEASAFTQQKSAESDQGKDLRFPEPILRMKDELSAAVYYRLFVDYSISKIWPRPKRTISVLLTLGTGLTAQSMELELGAPLFEKQSPECGLGGRFQTCFT